MDDSFGERLRDQREGKGLSQAELAEKAGLQPSAISHFEAGRRAPSMENLRRIADGLSVTVDFLLGREVSPMPAGPVAEQLLRNFEQMSAADQDNLVRFAHMLAQKANDPR